MMMTLWIVMIKTIMTTTLAHHTGHFWWAATVS